MALDIHNQILENINKSGSILITFRRNYSLDSLAAATAFYLFLKRINKESDVVVDGFQLPKNYTFLPPIPVKTQFDNLQKFIISLKLNQSEIDQFSYQIEDDKLNIYITPKAGSFKNEDIQSSVTNFKYDLVVVVDSPDLYSLGKIYESNTDFFYQKPIINIDHNPANEQYGQINHIDLTATAVTEILYDLMGNWERNFIDGDIATCLLAGMIAKTNNFKTPKVTPKTLNTAAKLIDANANREAIIKNLYFSQTISSLKLWGRALARLKGDLEHKLVWTLLTEHDFIESETTEIELKGVVEELISRLPKTEIVVLIYQQRNLVKVAVQTLKNLNSLLLIKKYHPEGGSDYATAVFSDKSLVEIEQEVVGEIKNNLEKLQNLV